MPTLNVRLAAILMVSLIVMGGGVHLLHGFQVSRQANALKTASEKYEKDGKDATEKAESATDPEAKKAARVEGEKDLAEAIRLLRDYVKLAPRDRGAEIHLGLLFIDAKQLKLAYDFLEDALRLADKPETDPKVDPEEVRKARLRLVKEVTMKIGPLDAIKAHIEILLGDTLEDNKRLKRDGKKPTGDAELLDLYGVALVYGKSEKEACEIFQDAISIAPDRVDSYLNLASVMRGSLHQEAEADAVIDSMIAKNPKAVPAYEKYVSYYLATGKKEKIDKAFSKAKELLKLSPDDARGLLLMGRCYIVKQEYDKAEEYIRKGIKASKETDDVAVWYTLLAESQQQSGKSSQSLPTLQEGVEATRGTPGHLELLWSLAERQIIAGNFKEAESNIKELRANGYKSPLTDFLDAQIAIQQQDWPTAKRLLKESVIPGTQDRPGIRNSAYIYLAQCYRQEGNETEQIAALQQAKMLNPTMFETRDMLAGIYASHGGLEAAAEEYRQAAKGPRRDEAVVKQLRILIALCLRAEEKDRDWPSIEKVLDELMANKSARPELVALRTEVLLAQHKDEDAIKELKKCTSERPTNADAWLNLIQLGMHEADKEADPAKKQTLWKTAAGYLDQAEKNLGDRNFLRLARANFAVISKDPQLSEVLKKLGDHADAMTEVEKTVLLDNLANISAQAGDLELCRKYYLQVAARAPKNVLVRLRLCELQLRAYEKGRPVDIKEVDGLVDEIEHLGGQGPFWLYGKAIRTLLQAEDKETATGDKPKLLSDARGYLKQAENIRNDWSPVLVLAGKICELQGDGDEALKKYTRAVFELGERDNDVISRTIRLLVPRRYLREADLLLAYLERQKSPLTETMGREYTYVKVFRGEVSEAEQVVDKSVAADSKDYKDIAWQGQMYAILAMRLKLMAQGAAANAKSAKAKADNPQQNGAAEPAIAEKTPEYWTSKSDEYRRGMFDMANKSLKTLQKSLSLNPQADDVWVALVQVFAEVGQPDKAKGLIAEAERTLKTDSAPLTIGYCWELANETAKAEEKFKAAIQSSPQNCRYIRQLADLYIHTGKPADAEPQLRKIIELQSPATLVDTCWARRNLAIILKARGGFEFHCQALALLDENLASNAAATEDERLKVRYLITDPRKEMLDVAIAGMEKLVKAPDATPDDRYSLAQLYMRKCDMEADRAQKTRYKTSYEDQMRVILGAKHVHPRFVTSYIVALMDRTEYEDADRWLATLEKAVRNPQDPELKIQMEPLPEPFDAMRLRAEYLYRRGRYKELGDKAETYIYDLNQRANRGQQIMLTAGVLEGYANRLKADHKPDVAGEFLSKAERLFESLRSGKLSEGGYVFYTAFLARQGRIDEALTALDQSWDRAQPDALQMPAFAIIKCPATTPKQFARLEKLLADAHKEKPSTSLLMVLSTLYEQQRQYDKAIAAYREVLAMQPKNFKVLNNIAVDLAHSGENLDEALSMVNRALDVTGPVAAILDTRAIVYVERGSKDAKEYEKALNDLNTAVKDEGSPEQYFHLAWVLSLLDRKDEASAALKNAQGKGLDPKLLNDKEIRVYDRLKDSL